MSALIQQYGLLLVFANVLALALGLPVPAMPTLILVAATYAASADMAALLWLIAALLVSVMASLIGDTAWYLAGRRYGGRTLSALCRLSLSRDTCMKKTERFYGRWGVRVLAVAKFIPGLSMVSVPMAGAMLVSPRRFLRYDAIGAALWAATGLGLGVIFAGQVELLLDRLGSLGIRAIAMIAAGMALYVTWRWRRRYLLLRSLETSRIDVGSLHALMQQSATRPTILDIRAPGYRELMPYAIPGAIFADERKVEAIAQAYPRDRAMVIYCACPNEVSAAWLASRLRKHHFRDVRPLLGGIEAWHAAGYDVVRIAGQD